MPPTFCTFYDGCFIKQSFLSVCLQEKMNGCIKYTIIYYLHDVMKINIICKDTSTQKGSGPVKTSPENQTSLHCRLHLLQKMLHVCLQAITDDSQKTRAYRTLFSLLTHLQVSNAEFFLENVGSVCACSQAGHRGQVAAVSAHRLHNEDATLGPSSRLFDPVAGLREAKQIWVVLSWHVQSHAHARSSLWRLSLRW